MVLLLTVVLLQAVWTSPALAHGNVSLVDRNLVVQPGRSATFEGELHYHRLVARITADGEVIVRFARAGDAAMIERKGTDIAINELIRCCDRGWTPYVLVLENDGDTPVSVDATATLVHDDLAVMAYGAEAGTGESILILGGIWAAVAWRTVRRPATVALGRAALPLAILVPSVLAFTWYGAARFGAAGPAGLLAGLSHVPLVPPNPVVSGATLLLGATMVGWAFAARRWAASGPAGGAAGWLLLGASLAGSVVLAAISLATTYGVASVAIASGLAAGLPLLGVLAVRGRALAYTRSAGVAAARLSGDRGRGSA